MDTREVELTLAGLSYELIGRRLNAYPVDDLIPLLDSESTKIGNVAADVLRSHDGTKAIIDAILNSRIKSSMGKVRATTVLHCFGKQLAKSELVYLNLLNDRSLDVVDNALFGLAFLQNQGNIPNIEQAMNKAEEQGKSVDIYRKAIESIRKQDPFIFSSGFHDLNDVWKLDRGRFSDRIGPVSSDA